MLSMVRKMSSPTLSQKSSASPDLGLPTPPWESMSPIDTWRQNPGLEQPPQVQIAWTAYQGCSRRMNSACFVNRASSVEEQRMWWEETSSICLNAMLLHNATLKRHYDDETAKHLEQLEQAYHVVQATIDSLLPQQEEPIPSSMLSRSASLSPSTTTTLVDDAEPMKHSKRRGLTTMFGRMISRMTTKEPEMEIVRLNKADPYMY